MGMYDNSSMLDDLKWELRYGSNMTKLITFNLVIWMGMILTRIVVHGFMQNEFLFDNIQYWLSVPRDPVNLLYQPWSIFTYMFLHVEFMHVFFNLLMLYYFGRLFTTFLEDKRIIPVYILGGLAGVLGFYTFTLLVPHMVKGMWMLGASAAVMAVIFATITFRPNHSLNLVFLGEVKLKWIGMFLIISDLLAISSQANTGGAVAHLGGALFGAIYVQQLVRGRDMTLWMNNLWDKLSGKKKERPSKMKVVHRRPPVATTVGKRKVDDEHRTQYATKQERMDEILDKISRTSIDSLTQEEKDFLNEMSKEL